MNVASKIIIEACKARHDVGDLFIDRAVFEQLVRDLSLERDPYAWVTYDSCGHDRPMMRWCYVHGVRVKFK